MTREEIRELADMVEPGEAITFPNGVTIDKRPVAYPNYYYTGPYTGYIQHYPNYQAGGYH